VFVQPGDVIFGQLLERVEGCDVVDIQLGTGASVEAFDDSLQFFLILGFDFGPKHVTTRLIPLMFRGRFRINSIAVQFFCLAFGVLKDFWKLIRALAFF
jgi:hypothetical protein